MRAAIRNDTDSLEMLCNAGADVNQRSSRNGWTALMYAARGGHVGTALALLKRGAQVDLANLHGNTALNWAAHYGHLDMMRTLLAWGASRTLPSNVLGLATDLIWTDEVINLINTYEPPTQESCDPVMLSPADLAAAECAQLEMQCDAVTQQLAVAPMRRDFILQREALRNQLQAARGADVVDFTQVSSLGLALVALQHKAAELKLSEGDFMSLAARHAALVQAMDGKCKELKNAKLLVLLIQLGTKLTALSELELSCLTLPDGHGTAPSEPAAKCDPAKLASMHDSCAALLEQMKNAPARQGHVHRRAAVDARLREAETAVKTDYALIGRLMLEQQTLEQEDAQLLLSEEDYVTLADRLEALKRQVVDMCGVLADAQQYAELRDLAAQLEALRSLDLSVLPFVTGDPVPREELLTGSSEGSSGTSPVPFSPGAETSGLSTAKKTVQITADI